MKLWLINFITRLTLFCRLFRLNKKLCSIENKHKLTLRWEEDNAHYTAALHKARLSREAKLRKQMQIEAVHMHYLIHHKEKSSKPNRILS